MIYHVTTLLNWQKAKEQGFYITDSLNTEGFIHASKQEQVMGVLERYYKNQTELILLHIDEEKLTSPLKYEIAPSINEAFPHVYGKINLEAIIKVSNI
jgi:uncharacterized protein (DUF952 family)